MSHRPIAAILAECADLFRRIAALYLELIDSYAADRHDDADHTQRAISTQVLHFVELDEQRITPLSEQVTTLTALVETLRRDVARLIDAVARIERGVNGGAHPPTGGAYE